VDGTQRAGRIRDAHPAAVPAGYVPIDDAANLYFRWESAFGGELMLGTEGVQISVFNAGYPLRDVLVEVRGEGRDGQELFVLEQPIADLHRGGRASFEVGSYLIPAPLRVVRVGLLGAEFGSSEPTPRGVG